MGSIVRTMTIQYFLGNHDTSGRNSTATADVLLKTFKPGNCSFPFNCEHEGLCLQIPLGISGEHMNKCICRVGFYGTTCSISASEEKDTEQVFSDIHYFVGLYAAVLSTILVFILIISINRRSDLQAQK